MTTDYLIIGQGISGTLLSRALMQAGQQVLVIDDAQPQTASKIASGLINPVTGKKFVTTWLANTILDFARQTYEALSAQFGASFLQDLTLLNFHPIPEAATLFAAREQEDDTYLHFVNTTASFEPLFHFQFGIGAVSPCYIVHVPGLLGHWRQHLSAQNALLEARFDLAELEVTPEGVRYQNIEARKIIFCQGAADIDNPYFARLNFQLNKGEALIAHIPGLPADHIYKHGPISMVPWTQEHFWVGSNFDRLYTDDQPTAAFRSTAEQTLQRWLRLPFRITGHYAALRPATGGQKPFIGLHPLHPAVGIFNGMGSKGCSLAPYFAQQFAAHLLQGEPLLPDADIQRYARILSR